MGNVVERTEEKIQNPTLTAIDNFVTPKSELAVKLVNASSKRATASLTTHSERKWHIGVIVSFGNLSHRINTLYE